MYLEAINRELKKVWPYNRRVKIVCHGHSIPCGYMAENVVKPLDAYPQLLLDKLSERFPHAVCSVITTAIGGENSIDGAKRFETDVLSLNPDVVTIDYGRNDMFISKEDMIASWESMILSAKARDIKVILITPAIDCGLVYYDEAKRQLSDDEMSDIIIGLAQKHDLAYADVHNHFMKLLESGHTRDEYTASLNHINRAGHAVVMSEIIKWIEY